MPVAAFELENKFLMEAVEFEQTHDMKQALHLPRRGEVVADVQVDISPSEVHGVPMGAAEA